MKALTFRLVLSFSIDELILGDSNKGGLPYGKLQPFSERLQSSWVTSISEAKAQCAEKIPIPQPKNKAHLGVPAIKQIYKI